MTSIHLDFESYSEADIGNGAPLYAEHPTTELILVGFAVEDEEPTILSTFAEQDHLGLWHGNLMNQRLRDWAQDQSAIFVAHNAPFEMWMWKNHMMPLGYPNIPPWRWRCTMAKALYHGLPGSLDGCSQALHLANKKDARGKMLITLCCKPYKGKRQTPATMPEAFRDLALYCAQDIRTERDIDHTLMNLPEQERQVWLIDRRINTTGVRLDLPVVHQANKIRLLEKANATQEFNELTGLKPTQTAKLKTWFHEAGYRIPNTSKTTMLELSRSKHAPENIKKVALLRIKANMNSLAKYERAIECSTAEGILREWARIYGAHTLRWTSGDMQLHNMMRPKVNTDLCAEILGEWSIDDFYMFYEDHINEALGSTVRGTIIPREGREFYVGDFAQVESRVLAWLSGERWKLEDYRNGVDIYSKLATTFWGKPVTKEDKEERQAGKVGDLSYGYEGGIGASAKMAAGYDVDLSKIFDRIWASANLEERESAIRHYQIYLKKHKDAEVEEPPISKEAGYVADILKQRWRDMHPRTVLYWRQLERAAILAVQTGKPQKVGNVTYFMHKQFLFCKLPSGRCMAYPFPRIETNKQGNEKLTYMKLDKGQWVRRPTYGGSLCENIVQAVARDLLVAAMLRLENIFPVILHVHDEVVSEVVAGMGRLQEFTDVVGALEPWAEGLPMAVDSFSCARYRK